MMGKSNVGLLHEFLATAFHGAESASCTCQEVLRIDGHVLEQHKKALVLFA